MAKSCRLGKRLLFKKDTRKQSVFPRDLVSILLFAVGYLGFLCVIQFHLLFYNRLINYLDIFLSLIRTQDYLLYIRFFVSRQ